MLAQHHLFDVPELGPNNKPAYLTAFSAAASSYPKTNKAKRDVAKEDRQLAQVGSVTVHLQSYPALQSVIAGSKVGHIKCRLQRRKLQPPAKVMTAVVHVQGDTLRRSGILVE